MAFTLSTIAAKDSAGAAIGGGLLAADKAGGGVGPFIMAHLIADGVAGTNLAKVDSSNRVSMTLDNIAAALTLATITTLGTITNVVHVDDNAGSITVDAPVGTPAFVRLSDGTSAIATLPVSLASVPSHAVTNAGTFAVQAGQSGTWTIGLSAAQTLATVTNLATIAGVAPAYGSGAMGATVPRFGLATDSPGIIQVGTAGTASTQVVTMQGIASMTPILATTTPAASEIHVGEVGGKTVVKTLAMSTDTSPYASGDLIADTQQLDAAFRISNGTGILNTLTIIDQDAQGAALYVMFHYTSTSLGTENSAPNISDANLAAGLQGMVAVATTDYLTVSGAKIACIKNIGLPVKAVSGTDDLYVSVLNATGTPTYTATGLNLALGILQD